ncbi:unnamed protein product [Paramecium sonneborni]|uniref:Uncharacterized protein n=1 Tax=Paramecium sonneborni TaxID=65129 RepID=A0A8S1Q0W1_9CILI|nr:unnamed protein product [Paramecium sonneborni]
MQIPSDVEEEQILDQYVLQQDQGFNQYPLEYEILMPEQLVTKTQTISQIINPKKQKFSFKNFPKLLGNTLVKKIGKKEKVPRGIQILIDKRLKTRQSEIKIQDLQQVCQTDEESKLYFQSFVQNDMFIHSLNSNKIDNPMLLIPAISNYWAAAQEPEKMISNSLMNKFYLS